MDIFKNEVDKFKFQSTNDLWNELGLNTSWSVGFVSAIIKQKRLNKKEDWYNYYFQSGEKRLEEIKKLPKAEQDKLLSPNISYSKYKYLNEEFGRTKEEIANKGAILYEALKSQGNHNNLTLVECKKIAYFRTVCETWNGIMVREKNTKEYLEDYFFEQGYPIALIDTTGKFDTSYAVDFELYYDGKILCGIQVKPPTYQSDTPYLQKAKELNENKNHKYFKEFNRPVIYIYSEQNGIIVNNDALVNIINIIEKNTTPNQRYHKIS